MRLQIWNGDNIRVMKSLPDNSVDSIVGDAPYGLSFMGKKWDYDVPPVECFAECLRILKPGGHLITFAGSRTYHRMACRVEDTGFEIRDMGAWLYGSGFPKSQNISKAIDKAAGAKRKVIGKREHPTLKDKSKTSESAGASHGGNDWSREWDLTAPATPEAADWEGWGTALKPAHEPFVIARKPFKGTVAANVLAHGVGALNINAVRITAQNELLVRPSLSRDDNNVLGKGLGAGVQTEPAGRWPANVIHDGSPGIVSIFPVTQSGSGNVKKDSGTERSGNQGAAFGTESRPAGTEMISYGDKGSAARFFYCAKVSSKERHAGLERPAPQFSHGSTPRQHENEGDNEQGNHHPTVKPVDLMRYLVELVTPAGGLVFDPWMGSGSTGIACVQNGFGFLGTELEPKYYAIAQARIAHAVAEVQANAQTA